jgi:hypothetical protein
MNKEFVSLLLDKLWHPLRPPGSYCEYVEHPVYRNIGLPIGVVLQHRFAFYHWLRWREEYKIKMNPPNLLTIDWHDDVGGDCDFTPEVLKQLNPKDQNELGLFCWTGLRALNDGHIAPAQYLNAIGNVYVILKQHGRQKRLQKDLTGNDHQIHYYRTVEDFLSDHSEDPIHPLILDIDVDYFTNEGKSRSLNDQKRVRDSTIKKMVSPRGRLMKWVFPRLYGLTFALESYYCGGIPNCFHIFDVICHTLGDPPLLSSKMRWRGNWPRSAQPREWRE